ncbi:hypothetical protein D9M68_770840 [compost metagenome]
MVVRPLSVSIPFHVALIRPSWRTEHPLRAVFEVALAEAADALKERLAQTTQT